MVADLFSAKHGAPPSRRWMRRLLGILLLLLSAPIAPWPARASDAPGSTADVAGAKNAIQALVSNREFSPQFGTCRRIEAKCAAFLKALQSGDYDVLPPVETSADGKMPLYESIKDRCRVDPETQEFDDGRVERAQGGARLYRIEQKTRTLYALRADDFVPEKLPPPSSPLGGMILFVTFPGCQNIGSTTFVKPTKTKDKNTPWWTGLVKMSTGAFFVSINAFPDGDGEYRAIEVLEIGESASVHWEVFTFVSTHRDNRKQQRTDGRDDKQ